MVRLSDSEIIALAALVQARAAEVHAANFDRLPRLKALAYASFWLCAAAKAALDGSQGPPAAMPIRDYIIKSGDEHLVWIETGTEPDTRAQQRVYAYEREGGTAHWSEVDGHRWAWVGYQSWATRFTWEEARDVVWNKLKCNAYGAFGAKLPAPIPDRWASKLVRLVPAGDTIQPASKRRRRLRRG